MKLYFPNHSITIGKAFDFDRKYIHLQTILKLDPKLNYTNKLKIKEFKVSMKYARHDLSLSVHLNQRFTFKISRMLCPLTLSLPGGGGPNRPPFLENAIYSKLYFGK